MEKGRLEAFSDGVLAIIITIMVLELKVPHGPEWAAIAGLWPIFLSYVLSFVYIGIYWNNHHHMMQAVRAVNGSILWANLHLLFWLSLLPFTTGWMGENHFHQVPTMLYGANLLCCAIAYSILQGLLIRFEGQDGLLARAVGKDVKGRISPVLYIGGIVAAWLLAPGAGVFLFGVTALVWLVPDRRIERLMAAREGR